MDGDIRMRFAEKHRLTLDPNNVPTVFHPLIPLAEMWGIYEVGDLDDYEIRKILFSEATQEETDALLEIVSSTIGVSATNLSDLWLGKEPLPTTLESSAFNYMVMAFADASSQEAQRRQDRRDSFLERLNEAFSKVSRPDNDNIAIPPNDFYKGVYDDVTRAFQNQTVETFTSEFASENYDAIYLFTPEAFQYYLPAYMRIAVVDSDSNIPYTILHVLTPPDDNDLLEYGDALTKLLTVEQKTSVVEIITLYRDVFLTKSDLMFFGEQIQTALDFWENS